MAVTLTPANTLTLSIGIEQIECQVTAHDLSAADPSGGETKRTACGDVVSIPADSGDVGRLKLTLFPERGVTGFVAWTWADANAGKQADFLLHVNPGDADEYVWSGKVTVIPINEKQDEYTKIETVDIDWPVTEFILRAAAPTP